MNRCHTRVLRRESRFIGAHELQTYLNGASREGLAVGSAVFQQVAEEYVTRRRQHRKSKLRWRVSFGSRRSLGWIPFKARALRNGHIEAPRFYRDLEPALGRAQRAGKKGRVRALHAKTGNRRKDFLQKCSTGLVRSGYAAIFVGNVNAANLARSGHGKSVLDAGWSAWRTMLRYKCDDAGVWFEEIDEAFSTRTCSVCNSRTGPRGREGLGIREWKCRVCGAIHDRDRNSACNILAAGRRRLAEGIPAITA